MPAQGGGAEVEICVRRVCLRLNLTVMWRKFLKTPVAKCVYAKAGRVDPVEFNKRFRHLHFLFDTSKRVDISSLSKHFHFCLKIIIIEWKIIIIVVIVEIRATCKQPRPEQISNDHE